MQVTPANRAVLSQFKPVARPRIYAKRKAKDRTPAVQRVDFLKQRFQPKVSKVPKGLSNSTKVEQGFFQSLSLLCEYYHLKPRDFSHQLFPINIRSTIEDISAKIKALNRNLYLRVYADKKGSITFETDQHIWGGNKLYYLPVEPLYKLFFSKAQEASKDLLVSIFAYLYQIVKVSYFTKEDSYLYYQYDMIADWMREAEDEDFTIEDVEAEVDHMNYSGDAILHEISQAFHLDAFADRLSNFSAKTELEESVLTVSKLAFDLMTGFPNRSFYDSIVEHEMDDEDYGIICPEHYLSFFWNYNGMFYDQVWNTVNTDLREYTDKDEPVTFRFDGSSLPEKNYEFEARILDLIEELCDVLTEFDHE